MIKTYTKYITEGKIPIFVAIMVAAVLRTAFYFNLSAPTPPLFADSYIWQHIGSYLCTSPILSYVLSFIFALGISMLAARINNKYSIIRKRTNLPFAFSIILLSCHPILAAMNPVYVALIFILLAIDKIFDCDQKSSSPRIAFDFGFYIAIGALFSPDILMYLPLFWIGLSLMRVFSFKAILTSLLGIFFIFWIVLFYFMSKNNIESFYEPLVKWAYWGSMYNPFKEYNHIDFGALGFSSIVLGILIFTNYSESYKDKIRTRINVTFINLLLIASLLAYILVPFKPTIALGVTMITGALTAAHFFALANSRWKVYFFYICSALFVAYACFLFM